MTHTARRSRIATSLVALGTVLLAMPLVAAGEGDEAAAVVLATLGIAAMRARAGSRSWSARERWVIGAMAVATLALHVATAATAPRWNGPMSAAESTAWLREHVEELPFFLSESGGPCFEIERSSPPDSSSLPEVQCLPARVWSTTAADLHIVEVAGRRLALRGGGDESRWDSITLLDRREVSDLDAFIALIVLCSLALALAASWSRRALASRYEERFLAVRGGAGATDGLTQHGSNLGGRHAFSLHRRGLDEDGYRTAAAPIWRGRYSVFGLLARIGLEAESILAFTLGWALATRLLATMLAASG